MSHHSGPAAAVAALDARSAANAVPLCGAETRDVARPIELIRTDTGLCVAYSTRLAQAPLLSLNVDGVEANAEWTIVTEADVSPLAKTPERALSFVCSSGALVQGSVAVTTPEGEVLRNPSDDDRLEDVVVRRRRGGVR